MGCGRSGGDRHGQRHLLAGSPARLAGAVAARTDHGRVELVSAHAGAPARLCGAGGGCQLVSARIRSRAAPARLRRRRRAVHGQRAAGAEAARDSLVGTRVHLELRPLDRRHSRAAAALPLPHRVLHTLWLSLVTTFFPALGASLHGALAQSEAYRLGTTSERLVAELQGAIDRIRTALHSVDPPRDVNALKAAIEAAIALILEEHQDWHLLVR